MTIEDYAKILNAQKLDTSITDICGSTAKQMGFINLFVCEIPEVLHTKVDGDARCKCSGVINGSVPVWETRAKHENEGIYLVKGKLIKPNDYCSFSDCPFYEATKNQIDRIRLHYSSYCEAWRFETEIPHATFNVYHAGWGYSEDDIFCKGIIIDTKNLKPNSI